MLVLTVVCQFQTEQTCPITADGYTEEALLDPVCLGMRSRLWGPDLRVGGERAVIAPEDSFGVRAGPALGEQGELIKIVGDLEHGIF